MTLRWTMEALWAAIAVIASVSGGLYTTVYHSGASAAQILQLTQHQGEQDKKIDATDKALDAQKLLDATVSQKLEDLGKQLDRIEKKL